MGKKITLGEPGTLDSSFVGDSVPPTPGKVVTSFGSVDVIGSSVAITHDGDIVVGGFYSAGFLVARYQANGVLDSTFSGDGKNSVAVSKANAYAVMEQDDGRLVITGSSGSPDRSVSLVRFNA